MPKKKAPTPTPVAPATQSQVSQVGATVGPVAVKTAPVAAPVVLVTPKLTPKVTSLPPEAKLVLWVASEAVPLASTGGLGDVVGALPSVLRDMGWDVRVCLPYYRQQIKQPVSAPVFQFDLPLAESMGIDVRMLIDPPGGVPTYLIDCPTLFDRVGLYVDGGGAFADNPYRFGVFQLAVLQLAVRLETTPAIIHSHDWHAALLPALVRLPGPTSEKLAETRTLFTIHNLQYQGDCDRGIIDALRMPPQLWDPNWAEHFDRFIPLKASLMTADRVTTVSPTYAEELRTAVRGMGLDGLIRNRGSDMRGLINGIDDVSWDPSVDKALAANYSAAQPAARAECTRAMRAELGLPDRPDRPLIGFIGRLVSDKGVDLILDALPGLLDLDVQVVVLGSGDSALETRLRLCEATYASRGFRSLIKFDPKLARRMYSAFDILLVPSRLEPCGLVQLYALRYGAVPIVHGVGGLRDTVHEGDNGFVFHEPSAQALADAVTRALQVWDQSEAWKQLQATGLAQDWSWKNAAVPYDALYREVLSTPIRRALLKPTPVETPREPQKVQGPQQTQTAARGAPTQPHHRPETSAFRLMVQGPRSLFAYWSIDAEGPFDLVVEERPSGVMFTAAADLPTKGERWLGALPDQAYRAFLRGPGGKVMALSNAVVTPLQEAPKADAAHPEWLEAAVEVGVFGEDAEGRRWSSVFKGAPVWTKAADGSVQPTWRSQPSVATATARDAETRALPHVGASEALHAPAVNRREVSLSSVSMNSPSGHSSSLASSLASGSGRTR